MQQMFDIFPSSNLNVMQMYSLRIFLFVRKHKKRYFQTKSLLGILFNVYLEMHLLYHSLTHICLGMHETPG